MRNGHLGLVRQRSSKFHQYPLWCIKFHGSGPSTAYACKSFFEGFQVIPRKVTVIWAPSRDVLLALPHGSWTMDRVQHAGKSCCVLKLWGFSKLDIEHLEIPICNHWFWKRKAVTQICEVLFLSRLKLCLRNGEDMNVDGLLFLLFPDSKLSLKSSPH